MIVIMVVIETETVIEIGKEKGNAIERGIENVIEIETGTVIGKGIESVKIETRSELKEVLLL